jgi:hypothetical protein
MEAFSSQPSAFSVDFNAASLAAKQKGALAKTNQLIAEG